jgi:hypothetical protein
VAKAIRHGNIFDDDIASAIEQCHEEGGDAQAPLISCSRDTWTNDE